MARKKIKKSAKTAHHRTTSAQPAPAAEVRIPIEAVLIGLTAVVFLYYGLMLYLSLDDVHFWADENVHAYISGNIHAAGTIPTQLSDDVYGGYEYSYPPLFHILNALIMFLAGTAAFKYTNLALLVLFIVGAYLLIRWHYDSRVALTATLLVSLAPVVAINSVRFMTEMLSMVLMFASFFPWLIAMKTGRKAYALVAGIATGLLMLSKQTGLVVLSFYGMILVWSFFRRRGEMKIVLCTIGAALGVYLPYAIWAAFNDIGVMIFLRYFLGERPEWAASAVTSFRTHSFSPKEFILLFYDGNGPLICIAFLLPLYHFILTRGRDFPHNYIFLLTLYLAGAMIVWHITNSRHTIVLLPIIAFLAGYTIQQVFTNKTAQRAIIAVLLVWACVAIYNRPDYRQAFNAPLEVRKMAALIKKEFPTGKRTLVIEAFDYLVMTGKPVIWPYLNLKHIPVDLFAEQTPFDQYDLLKRYDIDLVLINTKYVSKNENFMGRNYPLTFMHNCELLDKLGKMRLKALSDSRTLILLEVI